MPRLAHLSLAVLGAALAVTGSARAGDYPPAASPSTPSMAAPALVAAPLDHKHYGRVKRGLVPCERCLAAAKAARLAPAPPPPAETVVVAPSGHARHNHQVLPTAGMPEGSRIVGCAHSSNGVCATCKTLLEMPGEVMVVVPGATAPATAVASVPGRAVATDGAPGRAVVASGEPEPIGVMRTNYAGRAPSGAPAKPVQAALPAQPGRAPFLGEQHDTKPHILGELFGLTPMRRDLEDKMGEGARRKREKHAAISYDSTDGKVQDLPASLVFGPGMPR